MYNCFLLAVVAVSQAALFCFGWELAVKPGPSVTATQGEVWPRPQRKQTKKEFYFIRPNVFHFKVMGNTCERLERALNRYKQDLRIHERTRRAAKMNLQNETKRASETDENFIGYLDELSVDLGAPCENHPPAVMDEFYELLINSDSFPNKAILISDSLWGILRGLETWSQLIYFSSEKNALIINSTSILDFPRFPHRGLLIDTSRHFLPLRIIYTMLDAMSMSKMNVLHWHIVDDQSFPFQSQVYGNLSAYGAYAPTHVYTPDDVQSVIAFAADRGIRVVPEFDTPGHTRSWGEGHPELLTECYDGDKPDGNLGPMNPLEPGTYDFMRNLLKEIKMRFPDTLVHLGGDEVELECWESNPEVQEYMKSRSLTPKNLEGMYVNKIIEMATELSMTSAVWQEVFDNGAVLPNTTIIHVWKPEYRRELFEITQKGHKVLLSSCWYLDRLNSGTDWHNFYRCDPLDFHGSDRQKRLVIGGEACMWGEMVDSNNILARVWPRACATAEKLWSSIEGTNMTEVAMRLEEHTCRMNRRKIPAQPPNGPGFCPGLNFS